jgi:membrane associated rhomboid family serine protease
MEDVQVDLCPRCMGIWFDAGELSRAAGLQFDDGATGSALMTAPMTDYRCPSCAAILRERDIGGGAMVDQCMRCSGLFVDKGEFSKIRQHYLTVGARPRPRTPRRPRREPETKPQVVLDADSFAARLFQCIMGLPLEMDTPQTLFPPVVTVLIAANVIVLVLAYLTGLRGAIRSLGLVPMDFTSGRHMWTLFTCMFMHAGVFHLLANMYFLYVAGDNVEERLGAFQFAFFYLLCGAVAGLAHVASDMGSNLPMVGASGAISGVLGTYVVLFPNIRFRVRWFFLFMEYASFDIPVWAYFGFWVLVQVLFAALGTPGVAWWAHLGGFACGTGIAVWMRLRDRQAAAAVKPARR